MSIFWRIYALITVLGLIIFIGSWLIINKIYLHGSIVVKQEPHMQFNKRVILNREAHEKLKKLTPYHILENYLLIVTDPRLPLSKHSANEWSDLKNHEYIQTYDSLVRRMPNLKKEFHHMENLQILYQDANTTVFKILSSAADDKQFLLIGRYTYIWGDGLYKISYSNYHYDPQNNEDDKLMEIAIKGASIH